MEMMRRSDRAGGGAAVLGGVISMPLLPGCSRRWAYSRLPVGVQLIGLDEGAFWSQMQASVDVRENRERRHQELVFGIAVTWIASSRLRCPAHRGRRLRATTRTVVTSSLAISPGFHPYRAHVYRRKCKMKRATITSVGIFVAAGFAGLLFLA